MTERKTRLILWSAIIIALPLAILGWRVYREKMSFDRLALRERAYKDLQQAYRSDSIYYAGFRRIQILTDATLCEVEYRTPIQNVEKVRSRDPLAPLEEIKPLLVYEMSKRGGSLIIQTYGLTAAAANSGNHRIVVEDGAGLMLNKVLKSDRPSVNPNSTGRLDAYYGFAVVNLSRRITFPLKVSIGNLITGGVDVFTVVAE